MISKNYLDCFTAILITATVVNAQKGLIYEINIGETRKCTINERKYPLPPIYCYPGNDKTIVNVFQSITVNLTINNTEEFLIYQDTNAQLLQEKMRIDESVLSLNKIISFFWRVKDFKLDPFQPTCFSIKTNADFVISISSDALDTRRLAMFIIGLYLFAYSARLSYNSLFYYLCGITIGVCASFLVVIFFISRFIPKKKTMLGFLGASCTLGLYGLQILVENLNVVLFMYYKYVIGYVVFSAFVSFVVCYRYGPVTNQRSIDLIRWTLQGSGLAMITTCSYHLEAMVLVDIISIIIYYNIIHFPAKLFGKSRLKPRLLSDDEYIQQGLTETPKALEELRQYCRSPGCDPWKVMSKLRNPKMFAEFMETSAHISDKAVIEHENENRDGSESETDDDSSIEGIEKIETSDSEME
ncbi:nuclear envelope integral membrane protein 1 [Adelges cooleyi]|uniref:nuclear envelope integral membrane protein 1 n=1 Tax=Adelges cooleyi TaxID=133065 RepID=UPI00218073D7|nr:nuclear envelope integral membrane protein 1 [Adelges cooleyi]